MKGLRAAAEATKTLKRVTQHDVDVRHVQIQWSNFVKQLDIGINTFDKLVIHDMRVLHEWCDFWGSDWPSVKYVTDNHMELKVLLTESLKSYVECLEVVLKPATKLAVFKLVDSQHTSGTKIATMFQMAPNSETNAAILAKLIEVVSSKGLIVDFISFDGASHKLLKYGISDGGLSMTPTCVSQVCKVFTAPAFRFVS